MQHYQASRPCYSILHQTQTAQFSVENNLLHGMMVHHTSAITCGLAGLVLYSTRGVLSNI